MGKTVKKANEPFAFLLSKNKCFMSPLITWAEYFEAIGLLLTGYYLFTGIKFYSKNLKNRLTGKPKGTMQKFWGNAEGNEKDTEKHPIPEQPGLFGGEDEIPFAPSEKEEANVLFGQAEELTEKIKVAMATAGKRNYAKEELIYLLKTLLQQYGTLNIPPYRIAINNLIGSECEKFGNHLNADELAWLWEK